MSLREEFVRMAKKQDEPFSRLCRRYAISRKTGYKWLSRFAADAQQALCDRSRRPATSPSRTAAETEALVVELRRERPKWGGRKLSKILRNRGIQNVPAPSTITSILRRHQLIAPEESVKHAPFERFERSQPHELWQMDYKGYFKTDSGHCHPLTILDDHSRFAVGLFACENERHETVKVNLIATFRQHGLPQSILCDNGAPWGCAGSEEKHTGLQVWLMQIGITVLHGRPFHPQTQGKDERFHRTLKAEVLDQRFTDLQHCQKRFDAWRHDYNWIRPHQALNMDVPGSRYRANTRPYPERPPEPQYEGTGIEVRRVEASGKISFRGQEFRIGKAFIGHRVAIEPTTSDGIWNVMFYGTVIKKLVRRSGQ